MIYNTSDLVSEEGVNILQDTNDVSVVQSRLKTKIVATLGRIDTYRLGNVKRPSVRRKRSTYIEVLREFYAAGVDVVRLNLSHFSSEHDVEQAIVSLKEAFAAVRTANGRPMSLLVDLPGPKIRLRCTSPARQRRFRVGDEFNISLGGTSDGNIDAALYVGALGFKEFITAPVRQSARFPRDIFANAETDQLRQNCFGDIPRSGTERYREFLDGVATAIRDNGCRITIGDGGVVFKVERLHRDSDLLECAIEACQSTVTISDVSNKGCTLENVHLEMPGFTAGDADLLGAALIADLNDLRDSPLLWKPAISFVGLSFCQSANDVFRLKSFLTEMVRAAKVAAADIDLYRPMIIAKIETAAGLANMEYIVDIADGIMVARGDLGLQQSIERIPEAQKRLIELCNLHGKPVITATQLLFSMARHKTPTRAEVTDVFNAVLDGTDAVMMSDETSPGRNPIESIQMMVRIAARAERYMNLMGTDSTSQRSAHHVKRYVEHAFQMHESTALGNKRRGKMHDTLLSAKANIRTMKVSIPVRSEIDSREADCQAILDHFTRQPLYDNLTLSACMISESHQPTIHAIVTATRSGMTARAMSRFRPQAPIIAATFATAVLQRLAISYGVFPVLIERMDTTDTVEDIFVHSRNALLDNGDSTLVGIYLDDQSHVVFVTGTPINESGEINHIQVRGLGI